nr:protein YgfX [Paraglaciecola sp. 20A4]
MFCVAYGVLVASVFVWQPNVFAYQKFFQGITILLITIYFLKLWRERESKDMIVQVSYLGEWNYLDQRLDANWSIGEQSKMLSGLLLIQLIPFLQSHQYKADSSARWCWVFRDRVSEQDYRRLCRCILASQQRNKN